MQINIYQLLEGAGKADGTTVIIDVFRAFSLACYIIKQGAERIIPVADIEKAYQYKKINPGFILIGERNNRKMPGFDFGNSPYQVRNEDFNGKTIIHTTSAGTQGMVKAVNADEIITGSFVNAKAIVRYLRSVKPATVSLVCMGYAGKYPIEEDTLCAEYIKQKLNNHEPDFERMLELIKSTSGKRFFNPETQEHCPEEDFNLCLNLNKFDFIIKAKKDEKFGLVLTKQAITR